jgi:TRAP-type C4-dicarboxylate transport system substrate-binding protein
MVTRSLAAVLVGCAVALTNVPTSDGADIKPQEFKVVGTWGNLSAWQVYEKPFWAEMLPKASGGKLTAQAIPITEAGLKGYEVIRLLQLNVFDFAHGLVGYVAKGNGLIEAADLAGMAQDFGTLRNILTAYRETLDQTFQKTFDARIVALHPWPPSLVFCINPIAGTGDLKGKKIRIHSASLGDWVEGAGGTSVTMSFGEVLPALQKGVVDCAITDAMSAYRGKWHEVVKYVMDSKLAYSVSFTAVSTKRWDKLDNATKDVMMKTFAELETKAWAGAEAEDTDGMACLTGVGKCPTGAPGDIKKVLLDKAGLATQDAILKDVVLKRWVERCGADCVKVWNATAGQAAGLAVR